MNCILCDSKNIDIIGTIDAKELNTLYKRLTGEDFSYLLKGHIKLLMCRDCGLKFYYPLIVGDERFYNALQKFEWYYMTEKEEFNIASNYINEGDYVLEIGCGKGAFFNHIKNKGVRYIGLELSRKAYEIAKQNGIPVENSTIEEYAKKHKNSFNVVCSFQVLEHINSPRSFLESSLEVLKTNGKLILCVPNDETFLKYVTNGILNMPPHHVTRWSPKVFDFIARNYNLEIVDIKSEKVQEYHKLFFLNTLFNNVFLDHKLIDMSLKRKLINKLSYLISKLIVNRFPTECLPDGHTLCVIFKKR